MSSKSLYLGLFMVAGLNLSFWGSPLQAEELRQPASSDCNIARNLLSGQTDMRCTQIATEADRKAKSDVEIVTIYETQADGEKVKKGIEVRTITEAGCDNCGVRTGSKVSTSVYGLEQLKDHNRIQIEILSSIKKQGDDALDELSKEVALKNAVDKCLKDRSGRTLDKEERFDCRLEKLADMDDEEAEKYFNQHLKADLEKKLLSGDASEREAALTALKEINSSTLSDKLENTTQAMIDFSNDVVNIDKAKAQAHNILSQANAIPDNHPQKAYFTQMAQQQAQSIMTQAENRIQTLRTQEFQKSMQGQSGANMERINQLEAHLNQAYLSSPELAQLKSGISGTNGSAAQANNTARIQRGGSQVPGGILTTIPQVTTPHPQNSSQLNLPNANGLGRGVGQSRVPFNAQTAQPIAQIQPLQQNGINGTQVYNWNQPFGQNLNTAPGGGAPIMIPLN